MNVLPSVLIGLAFLGLTVVAVPRAAVMWTAWRSPEVVFSVSTDDRLVALTLDAGPSSATPHLLDDLGGSAVYRPGGGWCDDRMIREARERGYRTAEILRHALPELRSRGYRIASVSTLLSRASDVSVESALAPYGASGPGDCPR